MAPGAGSVSPATAVTDAQGRAQTSFTLGPFTTLPGSVNYMRASVAARGTATSVTLRENALDFATQLVVYLGGPGDNLRTANYPFGVGVVPLDVHGNVGAYSGPIFLSLYANPGGGVLSGTTVLTDTAAIVTEDFIVSIDQPANGYTLIATAPGLLPGVSGAFNVVQQAPLRSLDSSAAKLSQVQSAMAKSGQPPSPTLAAALGDLDAALDRALAELTKAGGLPTLDDRIIPTPADTPTPADRVSPGR
jgi:hypothetical protein